jgi:hypothetical protein
MSAYPVLVRGGPSVDHRIIYGLVDPRQPDVVRYVGQTTRPAMERYCAHIAGRGAAVRMATWLASMRDEGIAPDMVLLERVARKASLYEREMRWIAEFRAKGMADVNSCVPGWAVAGLPCPKRKRKKARSLDSKVWRGVLHDPPPLVPQEPVVSRRDLIFAALSCALCGRKTGECGCWAKRGGAA